MKNKLVSTNNIKNYYEEILIDFFKGRPELLKTPLMKEIFSGVKDISKSLNQLAGISSTSLKLLGTFMYHKFGKNCFEFAETLFLQHSIAYMVQNLEKMNTPELEDFFSLSTIEISVVNRYYKLLPYIIDFIDKSDKEEISILDVGCAPQGKDGSPTIERLVDYLRNKYPAKKFKVLATDIKIPKGLAEHNGVHYVKDDISNTKLTNEKFDIVILRKVFLFDGITVEKDLYERAFRNVQKISSDGLLFFDSVKNNFMFIYEKGIYKSKTITGDHYLMERDCFLNNSLERMIQYIKPFPEEMMKEMLKITSGTDSLPDDLVAITYIGALNYLFIFDEKNWLRENTNLLKAREDFWQAAKINFKKKVSFDLNTIREKIRIFEQIHKKYLEEIIQAEKEKKYPNSLYLSLFSIDAILTFFRAIEESPKEFELFFNKYIKHLSSETKGTQLKEFLKARMSVELWDGKPLFRAIYEQLPLSFKGDSRHLYEIPFEFISIRKPMFQDGYKLILRNSITGEDAKVLVTGKKTFLKN
jgi:hypothetical protein